MTDSTWTGEVKSVCAQVLTESVQSVSKQEVIAREQVASECMWRESHQWGQLLLREIAARAGHEQFDAGRVQLVVIQGVSTRQQAAAGLHSMVTIITQCVLTQHSRYHYTVCPYTTQSLSLHSVSLYSTVTISTQCVLTQHNHYHYTVCPYTAQSLSLHSVSLHSTVTIITQCVLT